MKSFFTILVLLSFIWVPISCSSDDKVDTAMEDPTPLEASTMLDISYGDHPQQRYDIYLPEGRTAEKTKVILLVHGGGWTAGDKADMSEFVQLIQDRHPNHAIVNMNYVLAALPNTPAFPNQFLDIDKLITKLTNESNELQIMPEFGMIGASAGAHLSLQYDYVYDDDDQVKFVADIVGPTDFTDPFYADDPQFQIALNLFVDAAQYPSGIDLAVAISPAKLVTGKSSPSLLFYGTDDPLVPLSNGERLNTALNTNNIDHNFSVYAGGHGDNWSAENILNLQNQISNYINTYLKVD